MDLWTVDHLEPGDAERHNGEVLARVRTEALKDLLERVLKASDTLTVTQSEHQLGGIEWLRIQGKIEGVNLVRSYIEEALR